MRAEGVAQRVEARVGEIGFRLAGLREDLAVAVGDEQVVDVEQLAQLDHLGVGLGVAGVVLRHIGDLSGLGLVDGVELLGVLHGLLVRLGEQAFELDGLLFHLLVIITVAERALHVGEQGAHDDHAGCDDDQQRSDLDSKMFGHADAS